MKLKEVILSANTGLDAIKRAPIVEYETGVKCIRIQDISQEKDFEDWGNTETTENDYRKFKLKLNDLLIARTGATVGVSFLARENYNAVFNNGSIRLRFKDTVNPKFIYYIFKTNSFRQYIDNVSCVATQPNLRIENLLRIIIPDLDLKKQNDIVNVLSLFDTAIDNNKKRIKTLEQMAENLYKEWFVRFRFPGHENAVFENGIPKGWEYKTAADLSSVLQRGISPDYDDEGEYTVISQKCIRTNIMDISESRRQTKAFKPELNLQDADTVICSTGTGTLGRVGRVIGSYPNTTFDSHVTLVRAKKNVSKQFLYGALKNTQTWFMNMGIGSTNQQELYISLIRKTKLLVPTDNLMKDYENIVKPIHDNIGILISDNENLIKQRDLLLPRLMSGKLEV